MIDNQQSQSGFANTLLAAAKHSKGYATFWDWPNKQVKERGIVRDLLKSISAERGEHGVSKLWSNPNPNETPDVFAVAISGELIAFEVTELVDQKTIEQKKRGAWRVKKWHSQELQKKLQCIIAEKDAKTFRGGPFAKVVLIIYTDEPRLKCAFCADAIASKKFGPCQVITEIYLLFSYVPRRKSYPYIRLEIDLFHQFRV
jgi:hypothetical protein